MSTKSNETLLNEEIRCESVRCLGEDGEQIGVLPTKEALRIAEQRGLDLVLIAPDAKPPVCKVMDYGKYRYQQEKKQKESKKKQKQIEIKEIKLSVKIAQNDINYKVKHAREFLSEGKHVRFRVFLKGRESTEPAPAFEVLQRVAKMIEDVAQVEIDTKVEGRHANMLAVPKKS